MVVLDSSASPQEQVCDQSSMREELETEAEAAEACVPLKRATILWERTLEDVIEDEEEWAADVNGVPEGDGVEKSVLKGAESEAMEETVSQAVEEEDVVIGKERYLVRTAGLEKERCWFCSRQGRTF